jgi:hypothetical protein
MLDLSGQLTFGQENLDFQNELAGLIAAGKIRIVLNLSDPRNWTQLASARCSLRWRSCGRRVESWQSSI